MSLWNKVLLVCGLLCMVSLQAAHGSKLPPSKTEKEQLLKKLEEIIHPLQKHFTTTGTEWVGNSVFAPYLDQLNSRGSCSCQTVLLDRILHVYEEIFKDMSDKSEKDVKSNLTNVLMEIKKLRHKYKGEHGLWRELEDMNFIKVKNNTVQKGALNEFLMVFDLAY